MQETSEQLNGKNEAEETPVQGMFGISSELESSNVVGFPKGGIYQGVLREVVYHEIGKKEKYLVLDFKFSDAENVRKFTHREFIPKQDDKFAKKVEQFSKRVKHLIEAYMPYPQAGIGAFTSIEGFFEGVAKFFNTGKTGTPIFKDADKFVLVHIKLTIFKNNVGFPIFPNFIESYKAGKETTLYIDKKFDQVEQTDNASSGAANGMPPLPSGEGDLIF